MISTGFPAQASALLGTFGVLMGGATSSGVPSTVNSQAASLYNVGTGYWATHDAEAPIASVVLLLESAFGESYTSTVLDVVPTSGEMIKTLRESSGMTWDQMARLFGVSRRAVHLWANGGRLNAVNEEFLAEALTLVQDLHGKGPDERRAQLFSPDEAGSSLFEILRRKHAGRSATIHENAYSPEGLIAGSAE